MKMNDLLPPFLVRILRSLFFFTVQWKGNYKSYQEAANLCKGYEDSELVDVVFEKTKIFKQNILSQKIIIADRPVLETIIGLCLSAGGKSINVIDFGGGFGYHYFIAKAILKEQYNIKWCIVETSAVVKRTDILVNDELFFVDNIQSAINKLINVDIIFSSSTFQYLPDPYQMLNSIMEIKAKYLFLVRFPLLTGNKEKYAIQYSKYSANGPGPLPAGMKDGIAKYPINFLPKKKLEEIIEKKYRIQMILEQNSETYTYEFKSVHVYGYLAKYSE